MKEKTTEVEEQSKMSEKVVANGSSQPMELASDDVVKCTENQDINKQDEEGETTEEEDMEEDKQVKETTSQRGEKEEKDELEKQNKNNGRVFPLRMFAFNLDHFSYVNLLYINDLKKYSYAIE